MENAGYQSVISRSADALVNDSSSRRRDSWHRGSRCARIAGLAGADEILVSMSVRDLVAGSVSRSLYGHPSTGFPILREVLEWRAREFSAFIFAVR